MPPFIDLGSAFIIALVLRLCGMRKLTAWLLSCCVMPIYILFCEFILPYRGGGASMLPIAIFGGGSLGAISGGLGIAIASILLKIYRKNTKQ